MKKKPRDAGRPARKKTEKDEVLYGVHPVAEAVSAGRRNIKELFVAGKKPPARLLKVVERARKKGIRVRYVEAAELEEMAASSFHQGICASVGPFPYSGLHEILGREGESREKPPFLLLLDSIEDPHNLGALVRTALCVGIDGVIIPRDRAAAPSPTVSKASAGAMEHVKIARVTNLVNAIKELKERGIWIAGMDARADAPLYKSDLSVALGLVVGGEDKGVRPLVRKQCDFTVSIPQVGPVNSLNASVAGAVVMYEAFRQRGA